MAKKTKETEKLTKEAFLEKVKEAEISAFSVEQDEYGYRFDDPEQFIAFCKANDIESIATEEVDHKLEPIDVEAFEKSLENAIQTAFNEDRFLCVEGIPRHRLQTVPQYGMLLMLRDSIQKDVMATAKAETLAIVGRYNEGVAEYNKNVEPGLIAYAFEECATYYTVIGDTSNEGAPDVGAALEECSKVGNGLLAEATNKMRVARSQAGMCI